MPWYDQKPVSQAVWPWPRPPTSPPRSRIKPVVFACIGWLVAALLFFGWHHRVMPAIVVVLSTLTLVGGLWIPSLHDALQRALRGFGRAVGQTLTYLTLVPFFYLVFPLARLGLRLRGRDPMARQFPAEEASCWKNVRPRSDREAMRRQG
jgi:hypothetical protein